MITTDAVFTVDEDVTITVDQVRNNFIFEDITITVNQVCDNFVLEMLQKGREFDVTGVIMKVFLEKIVFYHW